MANRFAKPPKPSETRQQITDDLQSKQRAYLFDDIVNPVATALLWLVLPFDVAAFERILGAMLIASVVPIGLLFRRFGRPDRRNIATTAIRIVVAITLTATMPIAWHPAMLVVTGVVVASIPTEPKRRLLPLAGIGVIGLALVAILREVDHWYLSTPLMILVFLGADFSFRDWRDQRTETDRRYDELIDRARIFAWEIDMEADVIRSVTGNSDDVLGYRPKDLVGRSWTEVVEVDSLDPLTIRNLEDGLDSHTTFRAIHRNGAPVTLRGTVLTDRDRNVIHGISTDVTELAEATNALRHQAEHDSLTGLANRAVLERELNRALTGRQDDGLAALLIIDLDRFKEVNDTLGHPAGDRLLRIVAERFRNSFENCDVVARIGGDEFALVLSAGSRQDIIDLGNQVYDITMGQVEFDGIKLAISCSIGIAYSPDHGADVEQLMSRADMAVYEAKRAGGGVRVFESTPEVMSVKRLQLTAEIPGALGRDEFQLYVQPLVEIETGNIIGAEGLARWHHPELALLTPGEFMDILEVSSDYHRFTMQMLEQAAAFAHNCAAVGHPLNVAVNLCSRSFRDRGLPQHVARLLDAYQLSGRALTLEVTEGDLLDDPGDTGPVFEALAEIGVRLSIDDFGTGYSSLQRLRALDVDEVKIDRSFVRGLTTAPADAIIVRTVIRLAKLLDHDVVAEGIENEHQLAVLRRFGCSVGQGYLFARPMPTAQLIEMIADSPTIRLPELPEVSVEIAELPEVEALERPLADMVDDRASRG